VSPFCCRSILFNEYLVGHDIAADAYTPQKFKSGAQFLLTRDAIFSRSMSSTEGDTASYIRRRSQRRRSSSAACDQLLAIPTTSARSTTHTAQLAVLYTGRHGVQSPHVH